MGLTGIGRKPDDSRAVPMCRSCHTKQHSLSEEYFWSISLSDPFELAANYYKEYGGKGGKAKGPRKIKPRKPRGQRAKIKGRSSFR